MSTLNDVTSKSKKQQQTKQKKKSSAINEAANQTKNALEIPQALSILASLCFQLFQNENDA